MSCADAICSTRKAVSTLTLSGMDDRVHGLLDSSKSLHTQPQQEPCCSAKGSQLYVTTHLNSVILTPSQSSWTAPAQN